MNTFIYVRGSGVASVDQVLYESLKETANQKGWTTTTLHIDQELLPLFYESGICAIFEVMKHCKCERLLVASADQLSINPEQLMRFNALLMEEDMRVYLQAEGQYLEEWVYDFKYLHA